MATGECALHISIPLLHEGHSFELASAPTDPGLERCAVTCSLAAVRLALHGEVDADDDDSGRDDVGGDDVGRIGGVGGVEGCPVDSCAPESDDIGGRTGDGDLGRLKAHGEGGCRGLGGGGDGSGAVSDGGPHAQAAGAILSRATEGGSPLMLAAAMVTTA